jgi:hypothetical protein
MKKMIYAATVSLACLSAIPATLSSTSLTSTADAAEEACELTSSAATTGGAIQQQMNAIAPCHVRTPANTATEVFRLTETMPANPVKADTRNDQAGLDENRSFCPAIPKGATADDFQYRAALEHCRYGF